MRKTLHTLIALLLSSLTMSCWAEVVHPDLLSFEQGIAPASASKGSTLTTTTEHYKHGSHSLQWTWKKAEANWNIYAPIAYEKTKTVNGDNSIYTFMFWVYNPQPMDEQMRVEFLKQGQVCAWFDYNLNFSGWRAAWLSFDRDMQGTPQEGMDQMRIMAPKNTKKGILYFDHIILSSLQDSRHHTADLQAPYINPRTESHWLVLLRSWKQDFDLPLPEGLCYDDVADARKVEKRLENLLLPTKSKCTLSDIENRYANYHIVQNPDGSLRGLPLFFERFGEAYEHWGYNNYTLQIGDMGLAKVNQLLLDMAITYRLSTDVAEQQKLQTMFTQLMRHLLDQGFQAGSAMGTLHHLGYSMRNFYTAAFLMRQPLQQANMLTQVQQAMEWFAGTGEVKLAPAQKGMDIDAFNTSLIGRLCSILLLPESTEKIRYMRAFSRWVDNGLQLSDGLLGSFKIDGTIFHHCNHYPAYAVGGLDGAVNVVWLLHQTTFTVSETGHTNLKNSLLAMRLYCNLTTWPISLSGRHPDGKGHLNPEHFGRLAICGTPDGTQAIDTDLAQAYLRLMNGRENGRTRKFAQNNIKPETELNGNWAFPYSCLSVHRRNNWMVSIKGHSRYIWNTETYRGCNLYGRYLNYGNLQITASGTPNSNFGSGFRQEGWDWNHFPGTTATVLPIAQLCADINNLDNNSGYEEMLQSDEAFCNGLSLNGQGIWGMKLHSHDKYDGSLHARKSVFCFDNHIIALGSNICSAIGAPTQTTLFQVALSDSTSTHALMAKQISKNLYSDGLGNYFCVRKGTAYLQKGWQHSLDEESGQPTQGLFAMAAIDHGCAPRNATYEYDICVQATPADIANAQAPTYQVLQCDSMAHIVRDNATQTTGYVLFEANARFSNSRPCLVMTQPTAKGMLMRVADPDLHFYEGPSDETFLPDGRRKERIIYSYPWIDNPSGKSTIELTLDGTWNMATPTEQIQISHQMGRTHMMVQCQHGMGQNIMLIQLK